MFGLLLFWSTGYLGLGQGYFAKSQSLPKEEWDRVAIIMVRRLRLQWKFMVIHRDKGLLAFALQGLSLRGEATWSRYKLRPLGLVFQQVWWWEIWWAIRIEYLVVIMKSKAMNINGSRRGKVWKPLVISIRRWLLDLAVHEIADLLLLMKPVLHSYGG
ncbi:hypothetical protein YC2023_101668 [Brassica napus]